MQAQTYISQVSPADLAFTSNVIMVSAEHLCQFDTVNFDTAMAFAHDMMKFLFGVGQ